MNDEWVVVIIVLGFFLIIAGSLIIHEVSETPYDKCLDGCSSLSRERNPELFVECIENCNINFKQNGEGG